MMLGNKSAASRKLGAARPAVASPLHGAQQTHRRTVAARVLQRQTQKAVHGTDMRRLMEDHPQLSSSGLVLPGRERQAPHHEQHIVLPGHEQQQHDQHLIIPGHHEQQQQHEAPHLLLPGQQEQVQELLHSELQHGVYTDKKPLRISWAGSGIYFWWQLGAMQYLAQRYDLTRVPMVGASGGALCAVLARCGVDPEEVTESAYKLSLDHNIWERPLGLVGVWGGIIESWLDALLPHNAAERCRGDLGVIVTQLPSCRQLFIHDFLDKQDLINCCMASAHVPVLLDLQLSRRCRGAYCVDGSFPDFFYGANCDHLECGGDAVVFDYFDDPNIQRRGRMDMLQLKEYSEIKRITLMGARYAAKLEAEGAFDKFHLEPVLKR